MPSTLVLDRTTWDVLVDASGNIAVANEPYALAQDAASAIKLFRSELWFDTAPGVPYFEAILGRFPSLTFMRARFEIAAKRVPGVVRASVSNLKLRKRRLTGTVKVWDAAGNVSTARF